MPDPYEPTDLRGPRVQTAPLEYRVLLDDLTDRLATFTWARRDGDTRQPAVVAIPRADWENLGRPGALDVPVFPHIPEVRP